MNIVLAAQQRAQSWHEGGLLMGMHWVWLLFLAGTLIFLIWAFWLAFGERRTARGAAARSEAAEEALRRRFALGEIDEKEFAETLQTLRASR